MQKENPRSIPAGRGVLAVVGRPNVGKSTLFNRLTGRRRALVDRRPGITRDRLYGSVEWEGMRFTLIDTGGLEPEGRDPLTGQMRRQVEFAIEEADAVLFLVDGRDGLLPEDLEIGRRLRESGRPVFLAVNKIETGEVERQGGEFHRLGFPDTYFISAEQGTNLGPLLEGVVALFRKTGRARALPGGTRIAIVGRPNVGKSSLVNRLLGRERAVVHDVAGTTRDAVDTPFRWRGGDYVLVDTAGIRKRRGVRDKVEYASSERAKDSIHEAEVSVLVVDATEGFTQLDVQIAGEIDRAGAGLVIALNKWDRIEGREERYKELVREARERLHFADYAPVLTISALHGDRVSKVLPLVDRVAAARRLRVPTAALNKLLQALLSRYQPPAVQGREFRPKYLTQAAAEPPTFVVFTGQSLKPPPQFGRYLEKRLREVFDFEGTPVRVRFRTREPRGKGGRGGRRGRGGRGK